MEESHEKTNTSPRILVVGSFMMDLVVRTPRIPAEGETIIGTHFQRFPGGKGANQAVAAARLGADVSMAGKLGKDEFGDEMLKAIEDENINVQHILRDSQHHTGVGSVTVDQDGNNRIVVVPGSNLHYSTQDVKEIESLISSCEMLVMQLEMDIGMTEQAIGLANRHQVPVLLNPAPAQSLSVDLLQQVTYLTPNESEAELLTGVKVNSITDAEKAARQLLDKGIQVVIITLAEEGALIADAKGMQHVAGFPVQPVDSVAAGDAFNGALAVAITEGKELPAAVQFANAVGALAVTEEGAIPSLPHLEAVESFLSKDK